MHNCFGPTSIIKTPLKCQPATHMTQIFGFQTTYYTFASRRTHASYFAFVSSALRREQRNKEISSLCHLSHIEYSAKNLSIGARHERVKN